jgi:hypothetical protein
MDCERFIPTFEDFINDNPDCAVYRNCKDTKWVYEILADEEHIVSMVETATDGKPPLLCVAELLETLHSKRFPSFDFNDSSSYVVITKMVSVLLAPFGYTPAKPYSGVLYEYPQSGFKYFSSLTCYEKTKPAKLGIISNIIEA